MMQFFDLFFWLQEIPALPVTPLSFLRAMWEVSRVAAARYPTLLIDMLMLMLFQSRTRKFLVQCCGSGIFIPDPDFSDFVVLILSVQNKKVSSLVLRIRNFYPGSCFFSIPDPESNNNNKEKFVVLPVCIHKLHKI
jgi:hypothetical protein